MAIPGGAFGGYGGQIYTLGSSPNQLQNQRHLQQYIPVITGRMLGTPVLKFQKYRMQLATLLLF